MIIFLGVPGSGKSTQGQMLLERGKLHWISTGEILREKASTAQKERMLKGKLLDSQEMIDILETELQKLGDTSELILDGFPRNLEQAQWLVEQNKKGLLKVSALVHLFADESVVEKRLLARGRVDDSSETIANRFNVYQKTFQPIIGLLKNNGISILEINADQTPEEILNDIVDKLASVGIES
jgi:adenylate kinase